MMHSQSVSQRRHAVPAEFHVVVQSAANDMQVRIVEARNDAPTIEVDDHCVRSRLEVRVNADNSAILDGEPCGCGMLRVERGDSTILNRPEPTCISYTKTWPDRRDQ